MTDSRINRGISAAEKKANMRGYTFRKDPDDFTLLAYSHSQSDIWVGKQFPYIRRSTRVGRAFVPSLCAVRIVDWLMTSPEEAVEREIDVEDGQTAFGSRDGRL
jgi:hypothetical protein